MNQTSYQGRRLNIGRVLVFFSIVAVLVFVWYASRTGYIEVTGEEASVKILRTSDNTEIELPESSRVRVNPGEYVVTATSGLKQTVYSISTGSFFGTTSVEVSLLDLSGVEQIASYGSMCSYLDELEQTVTYSCEGNGVAAISSNGLNSTLLFDDSTDKDITAPINAQHLGIVASSSRTSGKALIVKSTLNPKDDAVVVANGNQLFGIIDVSTGQINEFIEDGSLYEIRDGLTREQKDTDLQKYLENCIQTSIQSTADKYYIGCELDDRFVLQVINSSSGRDEEHKLNEELEVISMSVSPEGRDIAIIYRGEAASQLALLNSSNGDFKRIPIGSSSSAVQSLAWVNDQLYVVANGVVYQVETIDDQYRLRTVFNNARIRPLSINSHNEQLYISARDGENTINYLLNDSGLNQVESRLPISLVDDGDEIAADVYRRTIYYRYLDVTNIGIRAFAPEEIITLSASQMRERLEQILNITIDDTYELTGYPSDTSVDRQDKYLGDDLLW